MCAKAAQVIVNSVVLAMNRARAAPELLCSIAIAVKVPHEIHVRFQLEKLPCVSEAFDVFALASA